ncbi:hypothetical protein OCAR_6704 [Afipia carboxidovorans OM5]|nr:hypothetical protein OCAR_6704 [Afipia carboxidovorans OM5]
MFKRMDFLLLHMSHLGILLKQENHTSSRFQRAREKQASFPFPAMQNAAASARR